MNREMRRIHDEHLDLQRELLDGKIDADEFNARQKTIRRRMGFERERVDASEAAQREAKAAERLERIRRGEVIAVRRFGRERFVQPKPTPRVVEAKVPEGFVDGGPLSRRPRK